MTKTKTVTKKKGKAEEKKSGSEPASSKAAPNASNENSPELRAAQETTGKKKSAPPADEEKLPAASGRNNDKYKFNGEELGKGKTVLALVAHFISKNPKTTIAKLKEVFPDNLMNHKYGVFKEAGEAKKISGSRERYFLKPEQLIKVGDKWIAVCNQITAENIKPFLKAAKTLGFVIK